MEKKKKNLWKAIIVAGIAVASFGLGDKIPAGAEVVGNAAVEVINQL